MIFFMYLPFLLSLSLSFLLHTFKKHIHFSLLDLATTFNIINAIDNYKLHPNSSTTTVHIGEGIQKSITCTESLHFQSIDINDEIDDNENNNNNNNNEDEDDCWRRMRVAKGTKSFPPPLPSLNGNGQPSFILVPVRKNGRLQLNKVKIKRPEILYATRQDGRLRLYLVPDEGDEDNIAAEEQQELVDDIEEQMEEKELVVESTEEEEEEDEENTSYEQKDIRIGEWKIHNERFRKCHQVVNNTQCHHHVHGSHQNLHNMYGVSIA